MIPRMDWDIWGTLGMVARTWSSSRLSCGERLLLRCDGNAGTSFPNTLGKDPSSRARRRTWESSGCGRALKMNSVQWFLSRPTPQASVKSALICSNSTFLVSLPHFCPELSTHIITLPYYFPPTPPRSVIWMIVLDWWRHWNDLGG